jgi:hypothetical protein
MERLLVVSMHLAMAVAGPHERHPNRFSVGLGGIPEGLIDPLLQAIGDVDFLP